MATRHARDNTLQTASARQKLAPRGKPYVGPKLQRGLWLNYRRAKSEAGSWVAKIATGDGRYTEPFIAKADDYQPADGKLILNFFQAQDAAKRLLYADGGSVVVTLDAALTTYAADLKARDAMPGNVTRVRRHLEDSKLLNKALALITADELREWRNGLSVKGLAATTVNRTCNALRAALELAMPSRSHVWRKGLERLPNANKARKLIFPDKVISALVAEAYRQDAKLGLLCDVLAVTGTRPVQAQRLRVEDLVTNEKSEYGLMMPRAGKGGGRNRSEKKLLSFRLPITQDLYKKLKQAAQGRADDEPLLLRSNGLPWPVDASLAYRRPFANVVKAVGLAEDATVYLFRHSSIVRGLLKHMPAAVVAALHDTSEAMIRQHYGKYIGEHIDKIAREALLQHAVEDTVVPFAA